MLIEEHLKRTEKDTKQPEFSSQNDALFIKKGNTFGKKRNQENNPWKKTQERSLSDIKCSKCGEFVHIARTCPSNRKGSRNQSYIVERNDEVQVISRRDDIVLSSASNQAGGKLWYIDRSHKTYDFKQELNDELYPVPSTF